MSPTVRSRRESPPGRKGTVRRWRERRFAQAAYLNKVPFVIVRAISDKADDSASVDYPTFEQKAIEHSVKLVESFVSRVPENVF